MQNCSPSAPGIRQSKGPAVDSARIPLLRHFRRELRERHIDIGIMRISISLHIPASRNGDFRPVGVRSFRAVFRGHPIRIFKPFEAPVSVQGTVPLSASALQRLRLRGVREKHCARSQTARAYRFRRLPEQSAEILHHDQSSLFHIRPPVCENAAHRRILYLSKTDPAIIHIIRNLIFFNHGKIVFL